ncbi:hypothetical protein Ahy_B01g053653 [Arachis hypogaea]|uniref:Uncharacterized protein n=1 Tax=Arachis hypogaea TaxID=3818 RepID=A0A445AS78_ARAHY|nr:hypothetical protein Ahy_B01g053653 [Arachis hypogaea]
MFFCSGRERLFADKYEFEWAWQHPVESLPVRKAAAKFKSLSGVANKIKLAYIILTYHLGRVNFSTKYMKHCAGCPSLPEHTTIEMGEMDRMNSHVILGELMVWYQIMMTLMKESLSYTTGNAIPSLFKNVEKVLSPLKDGIVADWDIVDNIWDHAFRFSIWNK